MNDDTAVMVRAIATDADHERALARINELLASDDAMEVAECDALVTLVDRYESIRWPIDDSLDPVDVIKHAMSSDVGHTRKELAELLGAPSRVSEILHRKRPLTLDMIRAISSAWGIPIALLTGPYRLTAASRGDVRPGPG